ASVRNAMPAFPPTRRIPRYFSRNSLAARTSVTARLRWLSFMARDREWDERRCHGATLRPAAFGSFNAGEVHPEKSYHILYPTQNLGLSGRIARQSRGGLGPVGKV